MAPQDLAISLATFATVLLNAVLPAFMFWVDKCREELHYWSNYMVHPLYFVLTPLVFAAFFIYLAARYNESPFALLGAATLAFATAASIYYATKKCGDAPQPNTP